MLIKPPSHHVIPTQDVLCFVMAAGEGTRLMPLTRDRAKPAVPIAGTLRIIDFVLTNLVQSGFNQVYVTAYYKHRSLTDHIYNEWSFLPPPKQFIKIQTPEKRLDKDESFLSTANSIYQNQHLIARHDPKIVGVFAADHVYYMDIMEMKLHHEDRKADATICAIPVRIADCPRELDGRVSYGAIVADNDGKVLNFQEKPINPPEIPGKPGYFWASMGNYFFDRKVLEEVLNQAYIEKNNTDFGKDILPDMRAKGYGIQIYDFSNNEVPGMNPHEKGAWYDVGNIDVYFDVNMMFRRSAPPNVNLYNKKWAIKEAPSKSVHGDRVHAEFEKLINMRLGACVSSLYGSPNLISGATIIDSVLSKDIHIHSYTGIENCIIFERVRIGERCRIRNAIIDKDVYVPANTHIGYDLEHDIARGFSITPQGRIVIPKGHVFK